MERKNFIIRSEEATYFLASIIDSSQDSVVTIDLNGTITTWNKAAEHLYGYPAEEVIGQPLTIVTLPEDLKELAIKIDRIKHSKPVRMYDTIRRRKDDELIYLEIALSPVKNADGDVIGVSTVARDIKARLEAEAIAREWGDRMRKAISIETVGVIFFDLEGRIRDANDAFLKMSGYTREDFENGTVRWDELTPPEFMEVTIRSREELITEGQNTPYEKQYIRPDGTRWWGLFAGKRLNDIECVEFVVDITERKRTEEALRKSEERLRVTLESAIDFSIITLDTERNITDWNNGAELMFGFSRSEAIGKTADIIFTPEDREAGAPAQEQMQAQQEGRAVDERWHMRKDGTRFFMSGVMTPMYNNGLVGFVKIARDMTERKTAEEALSISEQRYRAALTSADMGAWDWDIEEDQIIWNEQHYQLLGLEPDMLPKELASFLDFVHPADRKMITDELDKAIEKTGVFRAEFRINRKDGALRWMSGYGRAVGSEDGKTTRMVGVMYDITERKELERQKDEFIGIASHELKTPVSSIQSYTEILHDIFTESNDSKSAELVEKLNRQVGRLTSLVHDLLDVTRITEGQMQLRKEALNLNELIKEIIEDLQRTAPKHTLVNKLKPAKEIHGDRERLAQVITNLISNAIKYSPNADKVIISNSIDTNAMLICIEDFGIGIPKSMHNKVFERFSRAADVSTFPGLGLGLFIARDIIRRHGGELWVESEEGKGSIFCFTIPFESGQQ